MSQYSKVFVMVIALCSFALLATTTIYAQPIGIMSPQPQMKSQPRVLSSENGRFVFGQISDSSKDKFMLDTFSGRLWRIAESGEIGLYLTTVPYRSAEGRCSPLPENMSDLQQHKSEKH